MFLPKVTFSGDRRLPGEPWVTFSFGMTATVVGRILTKNAFVGLPEHTNEKTWDCDRYDL